MCVIIIKRLISYAGERVPKELVVFLDQATRFFDMKVFLREQTLPARSVHRGRKTVRGLVCHKSPHTPGRIRASECACCFHRETPSSPCSFPSFPAKKPLPPVKVKFASDGFAD